MRSGRLLLDEGPGDASAASAVASAASAGTRVRGGRHPRTMGGGKHGGKKGGDDDDDGADASPPQRIILSFAASAVTRADFDRVTGKVCSAGPPVVAVGCVVAFALSLLMLAAAATARKLAAHPWFVAADAALARQRAAVRQLRANAGAVYMTPVPLPPQSPSGGGGDTLYRFVDGVGFVAVGADAAPAPAPQPQLPPQAAQPPHAVYAQQPPPPPQLQLQQQAGARRHPLIRAVGSTFATAGDMLRTLVQPSRAYYMPVTAEDPAVEMAPRAAAAAAAATGYPASAPAFAAYSDAAAPTFVAAAPTAVPAPAPGSAAAYTYAVRV
jgi:hypothetical protein